MQYKKGQTGNPDGRPPKGFSLTELLREGGREEITFRGERVPRNKALVTLLFEGAINGVVDMGEVRFELTHKNWLPVVKFIVERIEGKPDQSYEISQDVVITSDDVAKAMRELGAYD